VANITDEAFPGYGELITQIWRIKQLEYTWLRSLMRRYEDFSVITRDSLTYTLKILGLAYNDGIFEKIMDKYVHLELYPDAKAALLQRTDAGFDARHLGGRGDCQHHDAAVALESAGGNEHSRGE